ncbi:MAG: hypothetical protein QOE03_1928 [Micromonosporaceae bacterium]|nr:hypothetical protein [Micromonosporaceae bacterium]
MAGAAPAPRRLVLTRAEWALLVRVSTITAPPGFEPARVDEPALRAAARALSARRVVTGGSDDPRDCVPVKSVAVNLAVATAPAATVRVEVVMGGRGLRAFYSLSGPWGGSLFTLADAAVELSLYPAETLGRELLRAVPPPAGSAPVAARVAAALGDGRDAALTGRLPLSALAGSARTGGVVTDTVTAPEAELAARVAGQRVGTLRCLVSGRGGTGILVGQFSWLATADGWTGLRPDPDGTDRRMVALHRVNRDDLGVWVAPLLAEILAAAR